MGLLELYYLLFSISLFAFHSLASAAECSPEKKKECPGLHESHDQIACCPSKVETGDYYCCTLEEKRRSEYSWKDNLIENKPELVGGIIAVVFLLVVTLVLLCFFCRCCYLYQYCHKRRQGSICRTPLANEERPSSARGYNSTQPLIGASYPQSYQPVPSEPKPYDAPPPYLVAQQYPAFNPSGLTSTIVTRNGHDYGPTPPLHRPGQGQSTTNYWSPKFV